MVSPHSLLLVLAATGAIAAASDSCSAADTDCRPERSRSLLQRSVAKAPGKVVLAEEGHALAKATPHEASKADAGTEESPHLQEELLSKRPEAVQSEDVDICEQDVFARPELCPAQCPYAAEMKDEFCHFRCVKKNECGLLGTVENATIPDDELMVCRHCAVEGCRKCVAAKPGQTGERLEHCQECMPGYALTEEGECAMQGLWVFILMAAVSAVATVAFLVWYCLIRSKPCVNPEGVAYGLHVRARMKLMPQGADSDDGYPLNTNLMMTNVAGPGTMVIFRYQFALMVWAVVLLLVWLHLALFVSSDLLVLGTMPAESPQLLCAVIRWGHNRQMDLVWTKVLWLAFAYVFSFAGAIWYGVEQSKLFSTHQYQYATMASFAAVLEGLPKFSGKDAVEEKLMSAVKAATGVEPVGVSVAWNYSSNEAQIRRVMEAELEDGPASPHAPDAHEEQAAMGPLGKAEKMVTDQVLRAWHVHLDHGHEPTREELIGLLHGLETTPTAYVIFSSQAAKAMALEGAKRGVAVEGHSCSLTSCTSAPESVFWQNMHVTPQERRGKISLATLALVGSCALWTLLLYIPYAFYMSSFSYANGDEPGEFSEYLFIGLVVGSQLGLFVVSSLGAKFCTFRTEDEKQKAYMLFYNSALILNIVMDIALQTYLSYLQMVGVGAHTSDGRLLGSLESVQEIFESYPVQKSVGNLLFTYCFPCTFLVPFLGEFFGVQWLPQHLGRYIVGGNRKIQGGNAERALELGEMEQGRYADLMFNVILVVCIPFIAPAYLAWTFAALILSHLYIYCYDQLKVLRYVRKFNFSSPEIHWMGMQLFAIPCSILAAALVFKANQMSGDAEKLGSGYLDGHQLAAACVAAALLHYALHLTVLEFYVKPFGEDADRKGTAFYAEAARWNPATHFSTNPIHCLRSKYIIGDSPPQAMYEAGKEHHMKSNAAIGAYFEVGSSK